MKIALPAGLLFAISAIAQLPPSFLPQKSGMPFTEPQQGVAVPIAPEVKPKPGSGTLRARGISVGKLTKENWRTDWGSYDRDYDRMQHIEVTIQPWGTFPTKAELEWVWFGRELGEHGVRVVLSRGHQPVTLNPGVPGLPILLHSGVVSGNVTDYKALGEKYGFGHKIEGWYVRLLVDGGTVSDVSSATYLADIARNPEKLAGLQDLSDKRR